MSGLPLLYQLEVFAGGRDRGVEQEGGVKSIDLKPCPFCGKTPAIYGQEIRDYVAGKWAPKSRKEFWIRPRCEIGCILGITYARALREGALKYVTPEAAARGWNRRIAV